jgi:hypothetical protein
MVSQKQEQILQTLGPSNPLVDLAQYRNTLEQICTLAGFKDASRYFKAVDMQAVEQQAQQQAQNQPPDPNMMLIQIEGQKAQAQAQIDAAKVQADVQDSIRQDQREREMMQLDMLVRVAEIEAKYGTQVNIAKIEATVRAETERNNAMNASMVPPAPPAPAPQPAPQMMPPEMMPPGMLPNA